MECPQRQTLPKISTDIVSAGDWTFSVGQDSDVLTRLQRIPLHLEDVTQRIFQGIKTGADKIFIVEELQRNKQGVVVLCKETGEEVVLEPDLLHPLIKGGDSKPYHLTTTNRLIIFPYVKDKQESVELVSVEIFSTNYPLTWRYLNKHRSNLENRENGSMRGKRWYSFSRSQALDVISLSKIFTPDIAARSSFSVDITGNVFFTGGAAGGYGILLKPGISREFILGLLNSRLLEWFIQITATTMRGGWFSYEARFIKHLPIVPIDFNNADEKAMHDLIVGSVEQIMEAKPKLAAAASERDRDFWQNKCDVLEKTIDDTVYKLYGLTQDEIGLVEGED